MINKELKIKLLEYINDTAGLLSFLYDIDALPEQLESDEELAFMYGIAYMHYILAEKANSS